eukprot:RCo044680
MPTRNHSLFFKAEKPILISIHPTLPWLVVCMKHDYILVLLNYEDEVEIARFPLTEKLEEKRAELDLLKEGSVATAAASKLGDVRALQFYDNDVICWSHQLNSTRPASGLGSCNIRGHWLAVVCEFKLVLLLLDASAQFAELNVSQLDNKSIVSFAPLCSAPFFAVGCSDGYVRLWNYETNQVLPVKLTVPGGKAVTRVLALHSSAEPTPAPATG